MNKIYLILLLLATSLLAKDSIEAIGYGNTENEALKSAYKNAVEEYVGVLVDTKVVIKNSKLIENKILTFSNGYIDSYKKISSKEQMGLWEVKIKAIVKEQLIAEKMEMLKIPPKNIENSEQIYAKLATQIKTKFDAEDMLIEFVKRYSTKKIYKELVKVKIDNFVLDTESSTRTVVPGKIYYSYVFNYKRYEEIAKEFELLLKAIGGKKIKSYLIEVGPLSGSIHGFSAEYGLNQHGYELDQAFEKYIYNKVGIAHLNKNNKAYLDLWVFPKSYKMIYPLKNAFWPTTGRNFYDGKKLFDFNDYSVNISLINKKDQVEWINNGYYTKRTKSTKLFNIFKQVSGKGFSIVNPDSYYGTTVPVLCMPSTGIYKGKKLQVKLDVEKLKNMKQILINYNYTNLKK